MSRLVLFTLLVVALGASGCGGSGTKPSTSTPAAAATPPTTSTGGQSSASGVFAARNLDASAFPGFQRGAPSTATGATAWVSAEMLPAGQAAKEVARLQRLGFVAGLSQHLMDNASSHEGLLVVEQFGSPTAARAETAAQYKKQTAPMAGGGVTPFAVPGVPGARAYKGTSSQFGGYNALFADGRYYYLVGAGWQGGDPHPPSRALVVSAAQHLYQRVHRLPGG
jgi:hypothetical protein